MKYLNNNFLRSSILLLFITLSFQACKSDKKSNEVAMSTTQSGAIFDAYLNLSDALIKSDAKQAQKHAYALVEAYEHDENEIVLLAVTISEVEDLEEQRTLYYQLSQRMEKFITIHLETGKVYKQFCPMAFDDTGAYWFSTSEEILNPYYGDAMLHCGTIQKTIE